MAKIETFGGYGRFGRTVKESRSTGEYTIDGSSAEYDTIAKARKNALMRHRADMTEYGQNNLVYVYKSHKKVGFVATGADGQRYWFAIGGNTHVLNKDGTLGRKA